MSKKSKIGKIEKKIVKKIEVLGNMSKIGKKCQDCVTDLKQAGVVIWVRKVRKVRFKKIVKLSANESALGVSSRVKKIISKKILFLSKI